MKTPILRPATEAVLFGFERIGMVIRIAWLPIVITIALSFLFCGLLIDPEEIFALAEAGEDPERIFESVFVSSPAPSGMFFLKSLAFSLVQMLVMSCVYVAITRASTLADYEPPEMPFYIALGGRELRYFVVRILYAILIIVATLLIGATGAGLAAVTAGIVSAAPSVNEALIITPAVAAGVWLVLIWLWVVLRFLPVLPIAAVENRIAFGEAWNMTKGNFWRLVLSGAMFLAIFEAVLIIFILALFVPAGLVLGLASALGASMIGAGALVLLAPLGIIAIVAVVVIAAFAVAAQAAWPARLYAYLSGCGEACRI